MKKRYFLLFAVLVLLMSFQCQAKSKQAVEGTDYVVTYQYFNVYEEYNKVKYQGIVEIQNIGTSNLYLGLSTFDIYDSAGAVASSETLISTTPNVIAPGEKGWFYNNTGYIDIPMGNYTMVPILDVKISNLPIIRYPIANTQIKQGTYSVTVTGNIANTTSENDSMTWISVVLFNSENQPIGLHGTNILDFNAGQLRAFDAEGLWLPDYITIDKVARYEVYSSPNQYQY